MYFVKYESSTIVDDIKIFDFEIISLIFVIRLRNNKEHNIQMYNINYNS